MAPNPPRVPDLPALPTGDDRRAHFPGELVALARTALKRSSRWRKLGVPAPDAEDILQNAFVRVLERREVIERGAVEGFFRKAVLREAVAHSRRGVVRAKAAPLVEAHLHVEVNQRPEGYPFRTAETECLLREATDVLAWLLEQVKPGRRRVAVECIGRILRDGELAGMGEIAANLRLTRGTVSSQWARAKQDMEAARDREEMKTGTSRVAALLALLASFGWWLVVRGRRVLGLDTGATAPGAGEPDLRADLAAFSPRATGRARAPAERGADRRRSWGSALLACVFPLAVVSHSAIRQRSAAHATFDAVSGLIQGVGGLADWQQGARAIAARMSSAPTPPEPGHDGAPERLGSGRQLPASRPANPGVAAVVSRAAPEAEGPRDALRRAALLLNRGRTDLARIALRDYRRAFPNDPRPDEYTRLLAAADRLDGARSGGIR